MAADGSEIGEEIVFRVESDNERLNPTGGDIAETGRDDARLTLTNGRCSRLMRKTLR